MGEKGMEDPRTGAEIGSRATLARPGAGLQDVASGLGSMAAPAGGGSQDTVGSAGGDAGELATPLQGGDPPDIRLRP